jgi:hypothetical protein
MEQVMTGTERRAIQRRARDLALELDGTARRLDDVAHAAEVDDPDLCDELDDLVICCEDCGTWRMDGKCECWRRPNWWD